MSRKVEREEPGLPEGPGHGRRRSALDHGFDRWLSKQLHQIYDPVLTEAVPEDMMRLLDRFDGPGEEAGDAPTGREATSDKKARG